MTTLNWQWLALHELDSAALYAVLSARQQVFVLEQQCLYADIDGEDQRAYHLLGWSNDGGPRQLLAYLRCFAPGVTYPETVLGRVLTVQSARGKGLGRQLMTEGIRRAEQHFPGNAMRISAQWHLERFYGEFGFAKASDSYLEDGIPHIEMLRK